MKTLKDPCKCVMGKAGGGKEALKGAVTGPRLWQVLTSACFTSPAVLRVQLLKHTKQDVVRSLCLLPKTQHDFSSLVVDMWVQTVSTCFIPHPSGRPRKPQVVGGLGGD